MKKSVLFFSFLFIFKSIILPQIVIENPEKPLNKNAGRVIQLEEVMRIKDDGNNVIFKIPKHLSLSRDGSIFFMDFIDSSYLYKFSQEGRFLFKALKPGLGPRECRHASNFFIQGNRIRVQAWIPPKVMDYTLNGQYIKEVKTENTKGLWFLKSIDGKIYGIRDEIPHSDSIHKEGLIESPYTLYEISEDFQKWNKIYEFPVRHYIKQRRWLRQDMIAAAAYDHFLFIVHTAEYRIVKFDLRRAQIERIFKRKYNRQKIRQEKEEIEDREARGLTPPPPKYYFDIFEIHVFNNSLWVITSTTKDNSSKWLVDVFDMKGNYIYSFFLQFPLNNERHFYGTSLLTDNGFIFVPEQNQDGYVSIGKYRINDLNRTSYRGNRAMGRVET